MTAIDTVITAVTPPDSASARAEARVKIRAAASPGDWLSSVLDHHIQIEAGFAAVKKTTTLVSRQTALKRLAALLTGHAVAEEAALHPALAQAGKQAHAVNAYTDQSAAKLQLGLLESIPLMSQNFIDQLELMRGAVAQHLYEEENNWFLYLKTHLPAAAQAKLTLRYLEEYLRYMGQDVKTPYQ